MICPSFCTFALKSVISARLDEGPIPPMVECTAWMHDVNYSTKLSIGAGISCNSHSHEAALSGAVLARLELVQLLEQGSVERDEPTHELAYVQGQRVDRERVEHKRGELRPGLDVLLLGLQKQLDSLLSVELVFLADPLQRVVQAQLRPLVLLALQESLEFDMERRNRFRNAVYFLLKVLPFLGSDLVPWLLLLSELICLKIVFVFVCRDAVHSLLFIKSSDCSKETVILA